MRDLTDRDDVEVLVRGFYTRAFADPLLGPIFREVARMDLAAHLPVMCDFWQTVLFRAGLYRRHALAVHAALHAALPLSCEHFARWLALWTATVDDSFAGEKAGPAKVQAARITSSISRRLLGESGSEFVTITRSPSLAAQPQKGGPTSLNCRGLMENRREEEQVTYVIAEPCIDVLDRAGVEECAVDCIYEGGRALYIHPDECVDCGACEPARNRIRLPADERARRPRRNYAKADR